MTDRARRPFWFHQIAEYGMGLGVMGMGLQDLRPAVPLFAGLLIAVNAAIVRGPLGAFRVIGRGLHRWLDVGVAIVVLGLAVQPWFDVELMTRVLLIAVLIPLGSVWYFTDWDERAGRAARRARSAGSTGEDLGRRAGRAAGTMWVKGRGTLDKRADD